MSSSRNKEIVGVIISIALISSGGFLLYYQAYSGNDDNNPNDNNNTITEPNDNFSQIEEIVASTFKENGFGPSPGENSTIESTFNALELLSEFDLISSPTLASAMNATYNAIMDCQAGDGGFHPPAAPAWQTDRKTTALCVRILRLMERLDYDTVCDVLRYLDTEHSFENWFNEPFDWKYWDLRCVNELDIPNKLRQIGLYELSLENIYNPGEDPGMDTGRPILWSNEIYFNNHLDEEPISRRLQILESFEYMVPNPLHRPTIFGLLVNESDTVEQLLSAHDDESGLFDGNLESTWMTYRTLTNTGNLSRFFDEVETQPDNRLLRIQEYINSIIDFESAKANRHATISEILLLTKISRILEFNLNHGFIHEASSDSYGASLLLHVLNPAPWSALSTLLVHEYIVSVLQYDEELTDPEFIKLTLSMPVHALLICDTVVSHVGEDWQGICARDRRFVRVYALWRAGFRVCVR